LSDLTPEEAERLAEFCKIRKGGPKIRFNDKDHIRMRDTQKRRYWRNKLAKLDQIQKDIQEEWNNSHPPQKYEDFGEYVDSEEEEEQDLGKWDKEHPEEQSTNAENKIN
jgi:hypothetical protein